MSVSVWHAPPGFDGQSGGPSHGGIVLTVFDEDGTLQSSAPSSLLRLSALAKFVCAAYADYAV
jgi:hypothetical protein